MNALIVSAAAACSHTAGMLLGVSEFISHGFQELPDGPATTENWHTGLIQRVNK